jgi:hypothetical protein
MKRLFLTAIAAGIIGLSGSAALAQNRNFGARTFTMDDGAGHSYTMQTPAGMTGPLTYTFPTPPPGNPQAGFVNVGTIAGQTLFWNGTNMAWEASSVITNNLNGNGTGVSITAPLSGVLGSQFTGSGVGNILTVSNAGAGDGLTVSNSGTGKALNATGPVAINGTLSTTGTVTLANLAASGIVHNAAAGLLSTSLLVNGDITPLTIQNGSLQNSAITVTGGTGLGVAGSPVSLGGTVTLSNTGVTSNVAGNGISVSGATGAVTITNAGQLSTASNVLFAASGPQTFSTSGAVTLNPTLSNQSPNMVLAGPISIGPSAPPTFRALVAADIPGGSPNYIQNQNGSAQSAANFWISGNGQAAGNLLAGGNVSANNSLIATTGNVSLPTSTAANAGVVQIGGATALSYNAASSNFYAGAAGNFNVGPLSNTGIGSGALANLAGVNSENTAVGLSAMGNASSGAQNVAVGNNAMAFGSNVGSQNVAIGKFALTSNGSGSPGGNSNVAVGFQAGNAAVIGGNNTYLGFNAGVTTIFTGNNNTFVGSTAGSLNAALTNATALGAGATVTTSNTIQLGNGVVTLVNTSGSITSTGLNATAGTIQTTGALNIGAAGSETFANLATAGVVHNAAGGLLSTSAVNLASADVTGILPVANGGTGSNAQNFVDLTTAQTVAGNKTLTGSTVLGATDIEGITTINTAGVGATTTTIGNGSAVSTVNINSGYIDLEDAAPQHIWLNHNANTGSTIIGNPGATGSQSVDIEARNTANVSLNVGSGSATTNIGTGSNTGAITIGNAGNSLALTGGTNWSINTAGNITTAGTLSEGGGKLAADVNGNLTKVNNITYSWPAAQASTAGRVLSNDGAGNLTWVVTGANSATVASPNSTYTGGGSLGTNQNNLAISSTSSYFKVNTTATVNVTGIDATGSQDGRVVYFTNVGTTGFLVNFNNLNAGSAAANQFTFPGAADVTIGNNSSAVFIYDATALKWRLISSN